MLAFPDEDCPYLRLCELSMLYVLAGELAQRADARDRLSWCGAEDERIPIICTVARHQLNHRGSLRISYCFRR